MAPERLARSQVAVAEGNDFGFQAHTQSSPKWNYNLKREKLQYYSPPSRPFCAVRAPALLCRALPCSALPCPALPCPAPACLLGKKGALLDHQAHHLVQHIRRRNLRLLSCRVVRRGHFYNVSTDNGKSLKSPKDGAQLARGPSTRLGRARGRGGRRVEDVDVN